ncbi:TerD family protein [Rhodococcus globerulus]|uniref:TerD family protein n=1 Tax=Rhodococcus globerulus TaxID=33008 RepID=UPI001FD3F851|nr:TerD family protein [Rhodococcus globerulus]
MTVEFVPGQNAPLQTSVVTFRASSQTPFDVSAMVADTRLQALSSDAFVFYNQPSTAGVQLTGDVVRVDLDRLHPDAAAVLCIVSVDPSAATAGAFRVAGLSARLSDESGSVLGEFDIPTAGSETAVICWELYRRNGAWKVRAVGQGYAGGLAELIGVHGVEVDDAPANAGSPTAPVRDDQVVEPVEEGRALERMWMIFEDASRSAASLISSSEYAMTRLDEELSVAVADASTRNSPAGIAAREAAQKRHDELVATARESHTRDSAQLAHELTVVDSVIPRAMASWESPVWAAGSARESLTSSDGVRLGMLSAPDRSSLSVPYCMPLPLPRPIWVDSTSGAAAVAVVSALTLRIMAAGPMPLLDVVDLTGSYTLLTDRLSAQLAGPVIRTHQEISARLTELAQAVDFAGLARNSGQEFAMSHDAGPSTPRLLILGDFPHGYSAQDAEAIMFLAEHGPMIGLSILLVGDDESSSTEESIVALAHGCRHVPAAGEIDVHDPWTGSHWVLVPDTLNPATQPQLFAAFDKL